MKSTPYFFLMIMLLAMSHVVSAVGISGSNLNKHDMFIPNQKYLFSYTGIGHRSFDNSYSVFAKDELAKYVTLDQVRFEDIPKGGKFTVSGYIDLPEKLEHPGKSFLRICILEDCPGGGLICGRGSACAGIDLMMLYPGILPRISFHTSDTNQDEPVDFTANIENVGEDDIRQASGTVEVYNIEKSLVGTATFETKSIASNSKETIIARFDTYGLLPGNYSAEAKIDTDELTEDFNGTFRIGTLNIKILSYTRELESGSIKLFETTIKSEWNDPLTIYAKLHIYDDNTSIKTKSVTETLHPWKTQTVNSFIDTSGLTEKQYDVRIEVFYAEKRSFVEGKIDIIAPIETSQVMAEKAPEEEIASSQGLNANTMTILLIIVVLLLTAVNIFLAVYKKKKE